MYANEVGSLLKCLESMDKTLDSGRPDIVKEQIGVLRDFLLTALSRS